MFCVNTQIALAREFEAALVRNRKPIEAHYYEGGGHNTYFTNATQRDDELKKMIAFLRRHLRHVATDRSHAAVISLLNEKTVAPPKSRARASP